MSKRYALASINENPAAWMAEAGVKDFTPPWSAFRCTGPHECIALADIEVPLRGSDYPLDANGFKHDRLVRLLIGIREYVPLPAVYIERGDPHQRPYRVREAPLSASLALGFSHIPAEIVEW
jgi:hypothetical protein